MKNPIKLLLAALGLLCVLLGVLGIFLPLLPTTPFLLLAAFLFSKSSERLHHWLITNRWFGEYIRNYREGRGMYLRHKVMAIFLLWLAIGYSAFFVVQLSWLRVALLLLATFVTVYLWRLKTLTVTRKLSE